MTPACWQAATAARRRLYLPTVVGMPQMVGRATVGEPILCLDHQIPRLARRSCVQRTRQELMMVLRRTSSVRLSMTL